MQAEHAPALQTAFSPQLEPSVTFVPASKQTEVPVEHEVVPLWQGFAGVQATPAVQAVHVPTLHTKFVPQVVPSVTFPVSRQTEVPVPQSVRPVWQTLVGVQGTPARHVPQAPPLQTWFRPQVVPFGRGVPESAQTEAPVEHDVAPV